MFEPKFGSYYFFFQGANVIMVDHFSKNLRSEKRERLLYLEANLISILDRTVKQDEILKGQYGALFATKTCFYTRPLNSGYSGISVGSNGYEHEVPVELSSPPKDLPPLTSVGLVRVFQADPQYVIVTGNYERDGKLGSLHLDKTKDGESVDGSLAYVMVPPELAAKYGIPKHLDIQRYVRSRRLALPPAEFPEIAVMMIQFFGYDSLIRRDELSHGVVVSSRFLQPTVTPEEKILNPVCEARFHQQEAAGLRTVD